MKATTPAVRATGTEGVTSLAKSAVPVLVVDDDPAKRLALTAVLLPLGYLIVEAESGERALRCVMARDFAVILLDVRMPIMDGFETATLIRSRRQSETTPIIFITGHASDELGSADGYVQGAVDFIFAPVNPDELRAKVSVFANLFIKAEVLATRARAVQSSADQLRLLTEAAPIGIFQTDLANNYVYTNPRWTEITGIAEEDAIGRPWDIIIGRQQHTELIAALDAAKAPTAELCHRFDIAVEGSLPRVVLLTSKSIPTTEGGVAGWVGTLADVTAEAGAEAAMADARDRATEASRLKSDFLANMSHEIRTPMNGVIGMTDLLLETELDARQRDYAQTVRNSGEALLTIINDILDFSKIEAGKLEVEDIEFTLRTIVEDVMDLLAGPAQTKGLELIAVIDSAIPPVVSGDPGRVRQILTNLIGNAIKFTQAGEVVVRVNQLDASGTDIVVRFEVADTGDGIAPDKLDTIFQPFVQADTSTSRKHGGTGLGLAISSQLVALMGGRCGVRSRLAEGSTFWFTVTVHADIREAIHGLLPPDVGLAGVTALIVDDNATQRGVLSGYMSDWGMAVTAVDSAEAALAVLRDAVNGGEPFSVALLDRSLAGTDGVELKNAIVQVDPSLAARLVMVSDSRSERESADDDSDSVVCASLTKPIHRGSLYACLRVVLGLQVSYVEAPEAVSPSPSATWVPERGRLLLAEDNLINQKVALAMLADSGYRVDTVLDGAAAVRAVASQRYDAILMDCQMPELNGYEATSAIRAMKGRAGRIPIIAMTAGARQEDKEHCLAVGMDSYLAKPVSKDALLAMIGRWVGEGAGDTDDTDDTEDTGVAVDDRTSIDGAAGPDLAPPALDAEIVDRLERLGESVGEDLMGQLAVLFLAEAGTNVALLQDAVAGGNVAAVARSAHSLRGASANLGATELARLCAGLEKAAGTGGFESAPAQMEAIDVELGRVRSALAELAPAPSTPR